MVVIGMRVVWCCFLVVVCYFDDCYSGWMKDGKGFYMCLVVGGVDWGDGFGSLIGDVCVVFVFVIGLFGR